MKTVTHVLYSFDELSEVAKSKAINALKQRAAIDYSDFDWELENESEQWFLNLAQCKVCVEQSSQGFYCRWHQEIDRDCNKTDEKLFRELQQRIQDEFKDDNFNHVFRTKCLGYKPNYQKSYSSYVADVIIAVCEEIYDMTIDYYKDTATIDYIRSNDIQFLENGKEYTL